MSWRIGFRAGPIHVSAPLWGRRPPVERAEVPPGFYGRVEPTQVQFTKSRRQGLLALLVVLVMVAACVGFFFIPSS